MTSIADILGFQGRREGTLASMLMQQQRLATEAALQAQRLAQAMAEAERQAELQEMMTAANLAKGVLPFLTKETGGDVGLPVVATRPEKPLTLKQFLTKKYIAGEELTPEEKSALGLTSLEEFVSRIKRKVKPSEEKTKRAIAPKEIFKLAEKIAERELGEANLSDVLKYMDPAQDILEGRWEELTEPEEKRETPSAQKSWLGSLAENVKKWWGKLTGSGVPTGENVTESFRQFGQGYTGTPIVGKSTPAIRKVGIVIDPETGERRKAIETVDGAMYDMETGERLQ